MRCTEKDCCNDDAKTKSTIAIGNNRTFVFGRLLNSQISPVIAIIESSSIPAIERVQLKAVILSSKVKPPKPLLDISEMHIVIRPPPKN